MSNIFSIELKMFALFSEILKIFEILKIRKIKNFRSSKKYFRKTFFSWIFIFHKNNVNKVHPTQYRPRNTFEYRSFTATLI